MKLSDLEEKYYVILGDKEGNYWIINLDFPSSVTYEYNLDVDTNETVFTFQALSNFPTLKLNADLGDMLEECSSYIINGIERLRLIERDGTLYSEELNTVYIPNGTSFKDVDFMDGTCSLSESFDGEKVTTEIQFTIGLDNYKPSWHYNLIEYDDNKYFALVTAINKEGEFISGVEFGLEPSYNAQGSTEITQGDTVTITLTETSQIGSLLAYYEQTPPPSRARQWDIVEKPKEYRWVLTEEWACIEPLYRWETLDPMVDYFCQGGSKYYKERKQVSFDSGETWYDTSDYRMGDKTDCFSRECGWDGSVNTRWVDTDGFLCNGYDKYSRKKEQVSYDGGLSWNDISGSTQLNEFVERFSSDCCSLSSFTADTCTMFFRSANVSIEIASLDGENWIETSRYGVNQFYDNWNFDCMRSNCVKMMAVGNSGTSGLSYFDYSSYKGYYNYDGLDLPSGIAADGINSNLIIIGCESSSNTMGYPHENNTPSDSRMEFMRKEGIENIKYIFIGDCAVNPKISGVCKRDGSATVIDYATTYSSLEKIYISSGVSGSFCELGYGESESYGVSGATALTEVVGLGTSRITRIGDGSFSGCTSLTSIEIPSTCYSIGVYAFTDCPSLSSITVNASVPPTINDTWGHPTFDSTNNCPIYVPSESVDAYKSASGWSAFASRIQAIPT